MREKEREIVRGSEGEQQPKSRGEPTRDIRDRTKQADASKWHVVHRKKTEQAKKKLDVARNYNWFEKDARRTTYFFTNFPENFLAKRMLKVFLNYGEFEEVFIPPKRDKRGMRFGFARAVNVKEPRRFTVVLDSMIIGRDKIMVNLPRFNRHDCSRDTAYAKPQVAMGGRKTLAYVIVDARVSKLKTPTVEKSQAQPTNQENVNTNPPFQLPIQPNPNQNRNFPYKPPPKPKRPWAHRHFNVAYESIQKYSKAYVGVVKEPGLAYKIQEEFSQQGYLGVKATPMGANLVLLENLDEGEMEAIIQDAHEWLKEWFSDLRKWCTSEVDDEYLTWVKVYGVLAHAWGEDFFKSVVFGTGEYVTVDESTTTKKALDVARILIRRKRYDVINSVERFMINGEIFIIKVVEDWFAPQWYSWSKLVDESSSYSSGSDDES